MFLKSKDTLTCLISLSSTLQYIPVLGAPKVTYSDLSAALQPFQNAAAVPHLAPPVPCTLPSAVKRSKALRQHLRMRPSSVSCDKTMECVSPSLMNSRASPILCSECQSSSITLWNSVLRTLHSCATLGGWFQNRPWIASRNGKLQDISQPLCRTSPWQPFHDLRRSENTGQTWKIGGKAWFFWCIPTPQHCLEYVSTTKHTRIRQRGQIWPCDVSWVLHKLFSGVK